MDSPAQVKVTETEKGRYSVVLEGQKLGQLIGRRGETLDAIQQLTNYAVNSGREKRIRVHVDAENYRAKREQSLESLARKVAGKVTKYRRSVTLETMNAYERHVIHAALQDVPGVNTYSIGTEPNRRVVVSYDRRQAVNEYKKRTPAGVLFLCDAARTKKERQKFNIFSKLFPYSRKSSLHGLTDCCII